MIPMIRWASRAGFCLLCLLSAVSCGSQSGLVGDDVPDPVEGGPSSSGGGITIVSSLNYTAAIKPTFFLFSELQSYSYTLTELSLEESRPMADERAR